MQQEKHLAVLLSTMGKVREEGFTVSKVQVQKAKTTVCVEGGERQGLEDQTVLSQIVQFH